ncbi:MAG: VIT1/CCC1 transporter family protein [Candidatus Berkelbacteria bacterium]|nr:MAG: VIT1/CCC1 transporter family protein [Candidatus Berkelbacteria bacterium]QQG51943.1 MAG: VIT1/CCC1 transporter family protein [Candidatus Berkelbacteria bacterium]
MKGSKGFLRNFVFGAEDGLVSTVGLLSGVSFAGLPSREIILSGVILIMVEAISMGAGVYISEDSEKELDPAEKENQLSDAIVMLFSYALIGLIPLLPYIIFDNTMMAFYWSIGASLFALFCVGLFKGYFVHHHPLRGAIKITLIGAVVIAVAVFVGTLIKI